MRKERDDAVDHGVAVGLVPVLGLPGPATVGFRVMDEATPTVVDRPERHRVEIRLGDAVAGFTEYHDHGKRRAFLHTEIDPAYEGKGLGSTLVRAVLDDARTRGLEVLPYCPFVRGYIARHRDEYVDLVPAADRATFDLAV
jgi:predicted GNAT family acetyltransferase